MKIKSWLGIDVGSVSIKLALINEKDELVDSIYLRNQGIIETIRDGFDKINVGNYDIKGVGCTGSGRFFTSLLLNADIVKTEILAHTIATLYYYPNVKTIFDIGGEDSKIMTVEDGMLSNFIMNSICGGGTGAMIEAIASRLGISIEEVGDLALSSKERLDFPGKCGIFCQSAVVNKLNSGAEKNNIMMGVVRALVNNYLSMAKGIVLGPPYVFQGATAQNIAIVKALEEQLNHKVIVPEQCAIMGAIGIALLTKECNIQKTKFNNNLNLNCETYNFRCFDCPNHCEVTQLYNENKLVGCVGSRCGKWNYQAKDDKLSSKKQIIEKLEKIGQEVKNESPGFENARMH